MKRKTGASLVVVLVVSAAMLIVGSVVASSVVNTAKFNAKYDEISDLELAAQSGMNIGEEYLINEINIKRDSGNLTSTSQINHNISESYLDSIITEKNGIDYYLTIERLSESTDLVGVYIIKCDASKGSVTKTSEKRVVVNLEDLSTDGSGGGTIEPDYPDDLVKKPGSLTQQSYDVSHMNSLSSSSSANWSDKTHVFRNSYGNTTIKPSDVSTSYNDYAGNFERDKTTSTIFTEHTEHVANYKEAKKVWGYLKVDADGEYRFATEADDGVSFRITVDGVRKTLIDNFKPKGWNPADVANQTVYLKKDVYYPIYIEYFNWGGNARFLLKYALVNGNSTSQYSVVPSNWCYPSSNPIPPTEDDDNSSENNGEINPINFLNITNNIYLGELNDNIVSKIAFGGTLEKGWGTASIPNNTEELKGISIALKDNGINEFKKSLKINDFGETQASIDKINFEELIVNKSDYNTINIKLNGGIRKVIDGIDAQGKEINIELDNTILLINGSVFNSRKIKIDLKNNSKLIVMGEIECPNGEITLNIKESFLDAKKNISASGNISITGRNSWLNVDKSIKSNGNGISIDFNNDKQESNYTALINVKEDIIAATKNKLQLKKGTKAEIGGAFIANGNEVEISLADNSTLNINRTIEANSSIDITLSSSSMANGDMDCRKSNVNIRLDKSNLIQGGIVANSVSAKPIKDSVLILGEGIKANNHNVEFDVENSPVFINGSIYSNSFNASLKNTPFIVNGNMSKENNDKTSVITFNNSNKSFAYIVGDIRVNALNLHSVNNIKPDDEIINLLFEFIGVNKGN